MFLIIKTALTIVIILISGIMNIAGMTFTLSIAMATTFADKAVIKTDKKMT
jgi:hypothetical protein